jgi:hypothetical protein
VREDGLVLVELLLIFVRMFLLLLLLLLTLWALALALALPLLPTAEGAPGYWFRVGLCSALAFPFFRDGLASVSSILCKKDALDDEDVVRVEKGGSGGGGAMSPLPVKVPVPSVVLAVVVGKAADMELSELSSLVTTLLNNSSFRISLTELTDSNSPATCVLESAVAVMSVDGSVPFSSDCGSAAVEVIKVGSVVVMAAAAAAASEADADVDADSAAPSETVDVELLLLRLIGLPRSRP